MWDIYEWYLLCHCGAVLRGNLDYGSMSYDLGLSGTTIVVFAILWRSSTVSEYSLASLHGCFTCRGRRQVVQYVTVQSGKQHTMNSFIVDGVFRWTAVVWKEVFPFHHWVIRTMEA